MVKATAASQGKAINVGELIFTLTMNIIYRAAFGSKNDGQEEFIRILQEFSKLFGAFNIADFIPWLGWIDPQGLNSRLAKARKSLDKFIDIIIDDHMLKSLSVSVLNGCKLNIDSKNIDIDISWMVNFMNY